MPSVVSSRVGVVWGGAEKDDGGGFFSYHGLWAPGIRLFRVLHFRAKALLIAVSLIVPLLGLLAWQIQGQFERELQARQASLQQHVDIAQGVLAWAQLKEAKGEMTRAQAMSLSDGMAIFKLPYAPVTTFALNDAKDEPIDFDKAIDAHRQWKVKLRTAIADHAQLPADEICLDNKCPLGKWLHGAGGQQWGHKPAFVALVDKHAEFHQVASDVARVINAGKYDNAERLIGSGSRFSDVSSAVAMMLTNAKRGL